MEFLLERFATAPERTAFIADGRYVTYAQLVSLVDRAQVLLREQGVREKDVVSLVGDYSPEAYAIFLACMRLGATIVPLTRQSLVDANVVRELAAPRWLIDLGETLETTKVERTDDEVVVPLLRNFLATGAPGLVLFSSGSSGKPKGILHDLRRVVGKYRKAGPSIVAIAFLTMDHFGGINTLLAITSGLGTVVTVRARSVAGICETVEKYRVEVLPTTPSFLNMLVRSDYLERYDLSCLRRITYGTEVMPAATLRRLRERFPNVTLQQTYGLSEVGVLRSKSRGDGSLWVRVGGEGFDTKVVDEVLWIRSQSAMIGYLNAPHPFDDDGWFNTEDRVEVDGEYLRIVGRVSDIIIVGGQKVYPAEVEEVIVGLDGVVDATVCGEANNLLGRVVVAKVELKEPEPPEVLRARVRAACSKQLAGYKVPVKVLIATEPLHSSRMKKTRATHG